MMRKSRSARLIGHSLSCCQPTAMLLTPCCQQPCGMKRPDRGGARMITLYGFGPLFGLPDPSPFVLKTEVQLKLAEIAFAKARAMPKDAPKGKIPYIEDDGETIADSTFIREHIEKKYGVDLDLGLTRDMRARAWAIERMLEDHLYWAIVHLRWADDRNFVKGPSHFFDTLPPDVRETTREAARRRVLEALRAHGLGRQGKAGIEELG